MSHIQPVLDRWQDVVDTAPPGIATPIRRALAQFRTANGTVNDIDTFDKAKGLVDDAIENFYKSTSAKSPTVAQQLVKFQDALLAAVDSIKTNDLGAIYSDARQHFSSRMRMRDALEAGRSAMTDGTEDALGHYMTLPVGEQRMYRIGLFDSANRDLSRKGKSSDITTYFDTPDKQQLLGALTGRSRAQPFNFSTRMQRFGDVLDDERNIANTQRTVLGGSQTAERTQDDAAFNQQTLGTLFASLRSTPSLTAMGIEVLSGGMTRMFGFTNSTAQSLAARLLNANPAQRDNILNSIEAHMPSAQTSQFRQFVADMAAHMAYVAKAQASQSAGAALAAPNSKE